MLVAYISLIMIDLKRNSIFSPIHKAQPSATAARVLAKNNKSHVKPRFLHGGVVCIIHVLQVYLKEQG